MSLSGYSLGGMYAQYFSMKQGLKATAFDSAALNARITDLSKAERARAPELIQQVTYENDPVHPLTAELPGAQQFGRQFLVKAVPGLKLHGMELMATGHALEPLNLGIELELQRRHGRPQSEPTASERAA